MIFNTSVTKLGKSLRKPTKSLTPLVLVMGLAVATVVASSALQNSSQHKVLFEKAKFTMETKGDLQGAIALFEEIIIKYPEERDYAAKSLYLMGICYEKLGERQARQAQAAFQRIVENYPDQTEEVNLAKEKLLVFQRSLTPPEAGGSEFRTRKVFSFGGVGRPTRDGRYMPCRDDSGNLAVIDMATGKRRLLTSSASWEKGDYVSALTISPDKKRIAYAWCRNYTDLDLKIANLDGSMERVLHSGKIRGEPESFWPVEWTPDGQMILGFLDSATERKIAFIPVADDSLRTVGSTFKYDVVRPEIMDLSPDGRWIAYDCLQDEGSKMYDIILMQADGSKKVPLVKHPADDRLLGWTPGGDSVLIASDRSGSWDAWIIPVERGISKGEARLVKRDFGRVGAPTGITPLGFTQDGSLYYEARTSLSDVETATLDMDQASLLAPSKKVSRRFEGTNEYPDWSPDGKILAFDSLRGPHSNPLCLLSLDTGEQNDIFPPELKTLFRITWHPDGKSVVVVGDGGIHRVDIDTGRSSPIVTEGYGFHSPRCTPDGKFVYYEEDTSWEDKVFRIMRVDLRSGEKKEIYQSTGQMIRMDISPDGQSLAFLEAADSALKVLPLAGGEPRVVYRFTEGWATSVTWSPDGRYLFFAKIPEGEGKLGRIELWRIPGEGGEPVRLPLVADGMENVRIHPDGKTIAFNTCTIRWETWVMENFLPNKK